MTNRTPAQKYHPKVWTWKFNLTQPLTYQELEHLFASHTQRAPDALRSAWSEGGVYWDRCRKTGAPPLATTSLPAGSIIVYGFESEPEALPINDSHIIKETSDWIAVCKPAWLPTQPTRASAVFCLESQLKKFKKLSYLQAMHRLDRETSGLLLLSKNAATSTRLMRLFSSRQMQKTYWAWISGSPKDEAWTTTGYMRQDFKRQPQVYFRLSPDAKPGAKWSETHFRVLERRLDKTLIEARPVTGRTHQIRVHAASLSHPVIGDTTYGPKMGAHRLGLHAYQLEAPDIGQLTCPPTSDFTEVGDLKDSLKEI
jgi:RluA family pseudouridine synthase